jgi:hypothetical protein
MRKLSWSFLSMMIFLTLFAAASCAPMQADGVGLPRDRNPIQAALTATTLTPITTTPTSLTFTPTSTDRPTSTSMATPPYTPTPTVDEQAVILAKELVSQFSQIFGVQFNPSLAKGLDTARIGGPAGQFAGMIAPVIDGNQRYIDRNYEVREVEGSFSLNDNRLMLEAMFIINKGTIQYLPVPLGAYMVACHPDRPNDCLAISLQGEEFQVRPESVSIITITPSPIGTPCPTCLPLFPSVGFEEGSIHTCFWVFSRQICIKVF